MKRTMLLIAASFISLAGYSTHLRGGYISIERISATSYTCRVTVTVFVNSGSPVLFGGDMDWLDFGDGSPRVLVPETQGTVIGPGVARASFSIDHIYPGPGQYTLSYTEPNRNAGIVNLDNSITTPFYIESSIRLDPVLGVFHTPVFLTEPHFFARLGSGINLSVGAVGGPDEIITYQVTKPYGQNYKLPENFRINPHNGLITWDTKFQGTYTAGEYIFAIRVTSWKVVSGTLHRLTTVNLDFQIILTEEGEPGGIADDAQPDENGRIYIPVQESQTIKIFYEPNLDEFTSLNAYSEIAAISEAFSFTTYDSTEANMKVGLLTLTSKPAIDRDTPYLVLVRGTHQVSVGPVQANDRVYLFYTRDLFPDIITRIENELDGIRVYPNPVADYLHVQLNRGQSLSLLIFDSSGKAIYANLISEPQIIDFRDKKNGVYFCRLLSGNSSKVVRIIKH